MITVNLNTRVGVELNEKGVMSVALNQYKKGEENNTLTTWMNVYIPEYLRDKASEIKKGTSVFVGGELRFSKYEAKDGTKKTNIIIFANYISKAPGANGDNFFIIRNARLGKDIVPSRNGGAMLNVCSNHFEKGEEVPSWITVFLNEETFKRAEALKLKKGSGIDVSGNRFVVEINDKGFLSATLNASTISYCASTPKKDQDSNVSEKTEKQDLQKEENFDDEFPEFVPGEIPDFF